MCFKKNIKGHDHPIRNYLWWCSGAEKKILVDLPEEYAKFEVIGFSLICIGFIAVVSGSIYGFSLLQPSLIGVLIGVIWGIMVFFIERSEIVSIRSIYQYSFLQKILVFIPRFIVSLIVGIFLTIPLKVGFFNHSIEYEIAKQNEKIKTELMISENKIIDIHHSISMKRGEINSLYNFYGLDIQKYPSKYGHHNNNTAKKVEFQIPVSLKNLDSLLNKKNEIVLNEKRTQSKLKTQQALLNNTKTNILAKMQILNQMTEKDPALLMLDLLMTLNILILLQLPLIIKLSSSSGRYDVILSTNSRIFSMQKSLEIQMNFKKLLDHSRYNPDNENI